MIYMNMSTTTTNTTEKHPRSSKIRWLVLALSTIMLLSIYYCYDIPSALKMQFYSYMHNSTDYEVQFGLLYSLYSFPNVILPLFAGTLVDRFGASICLLVFCFIYCSGQICFTIGVSQKSWLFMDIGRFFLGFGGEAFKVANYALLPDWFQPNELSFVNAIASLSRFGNVLVNIITPNLATRYSLQVALAPGVLLCGFALISVLFLQYINYRYPRADGKDESPSYELVRNPMNRSDSGDDVESSYGDDEDKAEIGTILDMINDDDTDDESSSSFSNRGNRLRKTTSSNRTRSAPSSESSSSASPLQIITRIFQFDRKYWLLLCATVFIYTCMGPFNNIASTVLLERDFFKPLPSSCTLLHPTQCQSADNSPLASCPSSHAYQVPLPANYSIYNPLKQSDVDCTLDSWKTGCTEFYCTRLNAAVQETSIIMSIPFILFAFTAAPLGRMIDEVGHRLEFLMLGVAVFFSTHLLLAVSNIYAIILMVGQGMGNVLCITTYWPLLPLIVDKKVYGTAYGLAMSLQNAGYVIMPFILAKVFNASGDYYIPNVEYCFVATSAIAFIPVFILYLFRSSLKIKF